MRTRVARTSTRYQPQQSVLNPQAGQRQTACMRYIAALPQRSQSMSSSPQFIEAAGVAG